jgi:hypothetical protein
MRPNREVSRTGWTAADGVDVVTVLSRDGCAHRANTRSCHCPWSGRCSTPVTSGELVVVECPVRIRTLMREASSRAA